jgi:hypothetical protein
MFFLNFLAEMLLFSHGPFHVISALRKLIHHIGDIFGFSNLDQGVIMVTVVSTKVYSGQMPKKS